MELFLITLTAGVCTGVLYGLVGLGFMAVYNASKVVNFSQGALGMVGAFIGFLFVFNAKVPLLLGIVLCMVIPMVFAVGVNFFLAEPLVKRNYSPTIVMIATLGGTLVIEGIVGIYTNFAWFKTSFVFGSNAFSYGIFRISPHYIATLIITAILCVGYWFVLNKTKIGLGIRATGTDSYMAGLVGIKVGKTRMLAWAISAGITGVAGFLMAPLILSSAIMGLPVVVNGFIAAIIGGFGNPLAAVVGGIVLGLLTQFFSGYVSVGFGEFLVFVVLILILALRPEGIMGSVE